MFSIAYVGNENPHQTYQRDINNPAPASLPALIGGTVSYNTLVPYPGFHSIVLVEAGQNSHYNALQTNFHARAGSNLTLQATYTYSKTVDPGTGFGGDLNTISNPYDRSYDAGPGFSDRTHIGLVIAGIRLHRDRVGFHRDALAGTAYLEFEIDTLAVSNLKPDIFLFGGLKSSRFGPNRVAADIEVRHDVLAGLVGFYSSGLPGLRVCSRNRHVWHGRARRVENRADNCGILGRRDERAGQEQKEAKLKQFYSIHLELLP